MTVWRRKKASISVQGVAGVIEADEEAFLAILAHHDGFEGVDVGAADLVLLLDLDGIPVVHEAEFAVFAFLRVAEPTG